MPNYFNVNNLNLTSASLTSNGIFSVAVTAHDVVTLNTYPVPISNLGTFATVCTGFNTLTGISAVDTVVS